MEMASPRAHGLGNLAIGTGLARWSAPIAPAAGTSGGWWNLTPDLVLQPSARTGAAIAYDVQDQQLLLFGGRNGSTFFAETWSFAHGTWTQLSPKVSPSPRTLANLAYDPVAGNAILFGGRNATAEFNDTWIFEGGNWTRATTAISPTVRSGSGMAFDPSSNESVLFGGENRTGSPLGDTWEFDGRNWTLLSISGSPAARFGETLTSDPSLGGILLFGGTKGGGSPAYADTWEFANGSWHALSPTSSPAARYGAASAIAPVGSVVLVFGGVEPNGSRYLDDLWQFQGNTWAPVVSAIRPDPRANGSMAWDEAEGYLLLVGGEAGATTIAETWVFARPISVAPYASALDADISQLIHFGASVLGGVPPYLFNWRTSVGSGSPLSLTSDWNTSFSASGTVLVTLLVSDRVGATGSSNLSVAVEPLPRIAANSTSVRTDVGLVAQLAATATGGVSPTVVFWNFGDGFASGSNPAFHRFALAGIYNASVTIRDAFGRNASVPVRVTVAPLPSASIAASPAMTDSGYPVNFSVAPTGGTGSISVSWQLGDGQLAFGLVVTHTYATAGQYLVTANLTDRIGGTTIVRWTENVTMPRAAGGSPTVNALVWIVPALLAIVGVSIVLGLRRRRAMRGPSTEPGLEASGASAEELPDAQVLAGGGQEYDEPERGE